MISSPFTKRKSKDFKILMLYPNLHMSALMPQFIGIFTSLLKRDGYTLDLFEEEILAIAKVFSFYIKFPVSRWNDIKIAEKNDDEGNKMFEKLGKEFDLKYRDYKASSMDLHD